jgi:hypothetical protein
VSLVAEPPRDLGSVKVDAGSLTRLLLAKEADRFTHTVSPDQSGGSDRTSPAELPVADPTLQTAAAQALRGSWRYENGAGLDFDDESYRLLNANGVTVDEGRYAVDGDLINFHSTDGTMSGLRYRIAADMLSLFRTDGKTEVMRRH